jgi:hypothetical protein
MTFKFASVSVTLALMALTLAGCGSSTPLQPTNGSATSGAKAVTTSTTPGLASPADGAQIPHLSQPVTLTVMNAVSTSSAAQTYTFEVATDPDFKSIVYSKSGVPAGSGGQTSLTLPAIPPATTYYWRARDINGVTAGPTAAAKSFAIGPEIILQTPVLASPAQNGSATGTATLVVNNVGRTGPTGQINYEFDLSDSSSFGNILFSINVPEQGGSQTSTTVSVPLAGNTAYFWRVQASDAPTGITSPFSNTSSFTFIAFDPRRAIFVDNPPDIGSWPETAKITYIEFRPDALIVDFDKRDGPDRWPDAGFGAGSIEYTLGLCGNFGGQWYCSAPIQFWHGRDLEAAAAPSTIHVTWYYDNRWGILKGWQPADGEQVAIWVGQGNLRDSGNTYRERSNFAVVQWDNGGGDKHVPEKHAGHAGDEATAASPDRTIAAAQDRWAGAVRPLRPPSHVAESAERPQTRR